MIGRHVSAVGSVVATVALLSLLASPVLAAGPVTVAVNSTTGWVSEPSPSNATLSVNSSGLTFSAAGSTAWGGIYHEAIPLNGSTDPCVQITVNSNGHNWTFKLGNGTDPTTGTPISEKASGPGINSSGTFVYNWAQLTKWSGNQNVTVEAYAFKPGTNGLTGGPVTISGLEFTPAGSNGQCQAVQTATTSTSVTTSSSSSAASSTSAKSVSAATSSSVSHASTAAAGNSATTLPKTGLSLLYTGAGAVLLCGAFVLGLLSRRHGHLDR